MKKIILLFTLALAALAVSAKDPKPCPSGYYNNAVGKSDQALLTALYNIISSHTQIGYDGLWNAYADTDTNEDGYYIDMYSNYDRYTYSNKCGSYSSVGDCINREHSVPKSWWGSSSNVPQYCDVFNIVPTDGKVNGQRSNYAYGECEGGTRLSNGSIVAKGRLGSSTFDGYSGTVFEVDDEYKGDFARAYFYMAACYNQSVSSWTKSNGSVMFAGNSYPVFTTYAINLLLSWHRLDPVSEKEVKRNNYAYAWQDNRNPFIDHPELAEYIWGAKQGQAWQGGDDQDDTPYLTQPASGTTVSVGTIAAGGSSVSKDITVKGMNLTQALAVSVSGDGFAVTPTTLTASAVNNGTTVTVTYSGEATLATGTLTLTGGEVSRTVSLTAGKQGDTPDDPEPTGDSDIETWEGCADGNGNYSNKTVKGAAFQWYFTNAGIFAQDGDQWIDEVSCRFGKNSNSSIAMQEDVAGTSGISFYANYWKNDGAATLQVLYSTNGGSDWNLLGEVTLSTNTMQQYTMGLNVTGNVRFMFQQTGGSRLNIDNIAIYAPAREPKEASIYFNDAVQPVTATRGGASSISEVTVMTLDNDEPVTVTVDDNFELSLDQRQWSATLTLDAQGETFYVRLADTSAAGTFEGTIAAVAGTASAYCVIDGEVTAPAVLVGDVNMDGNISIADVTTLIDYLLGGNPSPCDLLAADVNGDTNVSIADVTALIDYLLSGSNALAWTVVPTRGGIAVSNPQGEALEVFDLEANLVATVNGSGNIALPTGTYMVATDTRSRKVVVR